MHRQHGNVRQSVIQHVRPHVSFDQFQATEGPQITGKVTAFRSVGLVI